MKPSNPRSLQAFCFSFFNYFDYGKGFQKCNHMNEGFISGPTENVAPINSELKEFCKSRWILFKHVWRSENQEADTLTKPGVNT